MGTTNDTFERLLAESIQKKVDYEIQRRQTAKQETAALDATYERANAEVQRQYEHAVQDSHATYRKTFDATNASALVARRQTEERARNMNAYNSGMYSAAQTGISQRRRAVDQATAQRQQETVDKLKRELDDVHAKNQEALSKQQAAIRERAQADIDAYIADQDAFIEKARAIYTDDDAPKASDPLSGHTLYAEVIGYLNKGYTTEQAYEKATGRDYASMSPVQAGKQKRDQVRYISPNERPLYVKGLSQPLSGSDLTKYRVAVNAKILWDNGAFGDTSLGETVDLLNDYLLQEAWRGNLASIHDAGDVLVTIAGGKEPYELFLAD